MGGNDTPSQKVDVQSTASLATGNQVGLWVRLVISP